MNTLEKEALQDQTTLEELITITRDFIALADSLLQTGKITNQEYTELTYIKKDFLIKAESEIAEGKKVL
ncbi:MAG: hypothetical protein ACRCTE_08205 [Cellulosilyticaceae bacterium]